MKHISAIVLAVCVFTPCVWAEDGYEAWLRYSSLGEELRQHYQPAATAIVCFGDAPAMQMAAVELARGLSGLLAHDVPRTDDVSQDGAVVLATPDDARVPANVRESVERLGPEGFMIVTTTVADNHVTLVAGQTARGVLHGAFHLLRLVQTGEPLDTLDIREAPRNSLRVVNHWDNPDGSVERGYSGKSIFHWDSLPERDPRYHDYARMLASLGINGCVVNNVNTAKNGLTGWKLITTPYLDKVAALADVFRDYGISLYLSVNFASPILTGDLDTADPLDPSVRKWWMDKANEIYARIPDFGGFLVKADSEGEPGPVSYGRNHADGANMLGAALAPHGGLVFWRAFVYGHRDTDRAMYAYANFKPLAGTFADNVIVQVKNGPMDFQVREPVSPLFGQMPNTNLMLELQITQEYTGHATHLCYLVPQWKYYLDFDTFAHGPGSTLAKVVAGGLDGYLHAGMSGVANIGDDRNWTGNPLAQANLYGYGRLAWNPGLSSESITSEWVRMTFGRDLEMVTKVSAMMLDSWEIYERYTSPLGVGFMCDGGHYDPDPAKRQEDYHHADLEGVGYDRTQGTGSGYTSQYHAQAAARFESLDTCPEELLLFFHHVPYGYRLHSGKTVIEHIYDTHNHGVEQVQDLRHTWESLRDKIDAERYQDVLARLDAQVDHARLWRDTINRYFEAISGISQDDGSN